MQSSAGTCQRREAEVEARDCSQGPADGICSARALILLLVSLPALDHAIICVIYQVCDGPPAPNFARDIYNRSFVFPLFLRDYLRWRQDFFFFELEYDELKIRHSPLTLVLQRT